MKYIFYLSILNILSCLISTAHAIEDNIISHLANEYTTEQETKMILHLNEDINISNLDTLSFNIPLPPGLMAPGKHLKIFHKDNEIKLYSTPHIWWKEISTNEDHSIRSLAVQIPNENYSFPLELSILFNNTPSDKKYLKPIAEKKFTTKIISLDKEGSKKEIPIQSPFVYPTFQPEWLSKCLLRSFSLPINKNTKLKWFDDAFLQYSNAYLNNTLSALNKSGNISLLDSEPWMYDLAATFFNMYIKTGDIKWLRHAHVTSQIYAHHIDEDGQLNFDSKKDLKYSYNLSILIDSILIGDESLHPKMEKIASFTSKWKEDYKFGSGFWTERHQTYSLLGSLVAWEATGKKDHLNNAIKIAEATINEALNPENNWEPLGCVLHTVRSHEGDDDDRPGCSPWMSALLSEAMFRYYLQSGDNNALNFVYNLAIFITKFGTYQVTDDRHLKGQHIPWYFAGKNLEYTDNGPWDDRQHACDVSGLLARGSWAGKILNKDTAAIHSTTENLLETCKKSFSKKIKPHRKYNWWFGTTLDLTFFLERYTP